MSTVSEFPLELNSWELHERSGSDRKIRHSVFVLQKTSRTEISRGGRVGAAKKCTKRCAARARVVLLIKTIVFSTFFSSFPSSLLKLPNFTVLTEEILIS